MWVCNLVLHIDMHESIFLHKREDVTGGRRNYTFALCNKCYYDCQIKDDKMDAVRATKY
jgi:hypothetical protein